jgi:uncharacterized protein YegJ (DUF2314 family)
MAPLPTVKSTSGEGFTFEEKTVAWLACHLLAGANWPPNSSGLIKSIDCQTIHDGWFFDDTVVTYQLGTETHKCGCSIKSYPIFGPKGAPADFAQGLWHQFYSESDTGFRRKRDRLALISTQHSPEVREAWFGLTDSARDIPAETYASRFERDVEPSQLRRIAYRSLQLPSQVGGPAHPVIEVAELLGCLFLVELDFEHSAALGVTVAQSICANALADSDRARAGDLWEAILTFCSKVRTKGGQINLSKLLDELAQRFRLKNHPSYAADWISITAACRDRMASLAAKIGGKVSIKRNHLYALLEEETSKTEPVPILGVSGNGKSVLARDWAQEADANVVWLTVADLGTSGGLRGLFGLRHGFPDLFASSPGKSRLVLDGLDKSADSSVFDEAALVLRAALAPASAERWRVVLTCCPEDWSRVLGEFIRREVKVSGTPVKVDRFSDTDLGEVGSQMPALAPVLRHSHLSPVLHWPKALDIIATNWTSNQATQPWATESALASWFWRSAIRRGKSADSRDRVARKLGVQLGDRICETIPLADFTLDEITFLGELAAEGHLVIDERKRSARFTHDLISDWARQSEIQAQGANAVSFLNGRISSPLWHRAIRFHGLELLESSTGSAEWEAFFNRFSSGSASDKIAQNLLLEAPIFAVEQYSAISRLWPIFVRDKGVLLRRFLNQFLQAATVPNEKAVALITGSRPDWVRQASTILRHPWPPYWFGVLAILGDHIDEAIQLAPGQVAEVCLKWLPLAHVTAEGIDTAANLAIASARAFADSERRDRYSHLNEATEEKICNALFAASYAKPDEVTEVALELAGRRSQRAQKAPPPTKKGRLPFAYVDQGKARLWPDGPLRRPSPIFTKVFMDQRRSASFLDALPTVAAEVMFAVLLNIPNGRDDPDQYRFEIDEHGFSPNTFQFFSCFWTHGPFLTFLRVKPSIALPAIIRLVNFASDRACELPMSAREPKEIAVTVDGEARSLKGHQYSYFWHKGHVFGPKAICCALLSLEKWLYLEIEEGKNLDETILTILRGSRSIALAGVLVCVGKRKPELFQGVLKPIIEVAEFHHLDEIDYRRGRGGFYDTCINDSSILVREWIEMPHRKESLEKLVLLRSFQLEAWHNLVEDVRAKWKARFEANKGPSWLGDLVERFDPANWGYRRTEQGIEFIFKSPASMSGPSKEAIENFERTDNLMLLPFQCHQILNGEKECTVKQLSEWWSRIEKIQAIEVPSEAEGIQSQEDALCAIVAVAVIKFPLWLSQDPSRKERALKILFNVLEHPPKDVWFHDFDSTSYRWDSFAARAFTALWCENPADSALSGCVAAFAMWRRYMVIECVFNVAAVHRRSLGEHFTRLLAHAIEYASIRDQFRQKAQAPVPDINDADFQKAFSASVTTFRSGKTRPLPLSWLVLAKPVGTSSFPKNTKSTGLDVHQIYSSLTWASDLTIAHDEHERATWIRYHIECLRCALIRIQKLPDRDDEDDSYGGRRVDQPYTEEDLVIDRTGLILAHLNPGEDHRPLWEPILSLGAKGAAWIRRFTSRWILEAAGHRLPGFLEQWKAMLEYVESCPAWEQKKLSYRETEDMWHYLLGFSTLTNESWDQDLAPSVEAVRNSIEHWAAANVASVHEAAIFIRFLHRIAARALRANGLIILRDAAPPEDPDSWTDSRAQDELASLLDKILSESWDDVVASIPGKKAFMDLVLKLVSLQNPLAAELLSAAKARLTGLT